jgi:hypothetical protein
MFRGSTNFNKATFAKNEKYEHGRQLKFKINILFYGDNSWKIMHIPASFIWTIISFDTFFEYAVFQNFEFMLVQMLNYFLMGINLFVFRGRA